MSIFDDIKGKAEQLLHGHEDVVKDGIEKAGDFIDDKTGDKFKDQIDGAQSAASNFVDGLGGDAQAPEEQA
ncbi:antitoxin [Pseudarthrobacter sp. P1]|uniref:antitoxin n=1 Tax=Pseudarthrobacter sp. P1 TaxID=3418418 RepID=UPI003CFAF4D0